MKNWQVEWGKLAMIATLMLGGFALLVLSLVLNLSDAKFTASLALGSNIVTGCMAYLFGNGRLASRGETSVPTISPRSPDPE